MTRRQRPLAARRQSRGLTQENLAERLGVERSTVARWEHGISQPQPWARQSLAEILDLSLPELDVLLGQPAEAAGPRIAICGSRATGTDGAVIDSAIAAMALFVVVSRPRVNHGPIGVGIEVMTYVADRYRPADLTMTTTLFGRQNVVQGAEHVLVVGGGRGTADEVELAASMGLRVIPFPQSGGTARTTFESVRYRSNLTAWMDGASVELLGSCATGGEFVRLVEQALGVSATLRR